MTTEEPELCRVIFLPFPNTHNFQILTQREKKKRKSKINDLQVEWSWLQTHLTISDRFAGGKGHNQTHQSHMWHKGIFLLKLIQQSTSWKWLSNSLAYLLEVSGDGSAHAHMHTHTHTHKHTHSSLFLLLPQSVPKAIPDWISGINASEVSIQWTHMSSIKGNPRLVIPNWVNRVACSRHMETTKHLKKMKTGNVLISCIKVPYPQQTHTHTHTHTHTLSLSLPLRLTQSHCPAQCKEWFS